MKRTPIPAVAAASALLLSFGWQAYLHAQTPVAQSPAFGPEVAKYLMVDASAHPAAGSGIIKASEIVRRSDHA